MIKIPFDQCVILTTLDFAQITDRLESAIYVGAATTENSHARRQSLSAGASPQSAKTKLKRQHFFGQIQGFKFLANRIVGHKYLHLPAFLSPTIEGNINSLHHGYEISLAVKLHNITCAILLTWLGGLLTTISPMLDNVLVDSKNYQYLTAVQIIATVYVAVVIYLYFDAWRTTRFFRSLFVKGFTGATKIIYEDRSMWSSDLSDLQLQEVSNASEPTNLLRRNLPSFPSHSKKVR
jgi:hypothetical protein